MLWIMYDLSFPTDARNLYEYAITQVNLPSGVCTNRMPIELGTTQGDTLSPFPFLLYMSPRRLHVGGRSYTHTSVTKESTLQAHLANNISSAAFADDLAPLTHWRSTQSQSAS